MSAEIKNLDPQIIWEHFYDLTQIPRPSKHEDAIQDFMVAFGEKLGLETLKDEVGNVLIRKAATPGMEDRKGVILQGHLDMVPQKNSDTSHDFTKDPIDAFVDGDWVTANGTTLGADNGIGVAAAMAVLSSNDLVHGPVEALFTAEEETGMAGAFGLQPNWIKGDILLNMDSEDEGELYVGCAGGIDASVEFEYDEIVVPSDLVSFRLAVTGLKGGHSGMDIILGLANANKLMVRFLRYATREMDVRLANIDGGSLRNAIPREAFAEIVVPAEQVDALKEKVAEFESIYIAEFCKKEPNLSFKVDTCNTPASLMDEYTQDNLIDAVYSCPNGVIRMSDDMEGLVETSSNLASVKSNKGVVKVNMLIRSSVESAKMELSERIESLFQMADAEVVLSGSYPGWKPNLDSPILKEMQEVYNNKWGKIPEIRAIHAGLECGLLGSQYPNWDMISFGPTIRSPHSPDEKVNIETVAKFWEYLKETLKHIPAK
ncbi:aminoacyl-histidine dipeptidase [Halosquirtibacter xylanolyticus]|uniref:aminoacyl-histidine dipeptidase n=1 Tax=Halosquirtibacter xylanolyticus TaxID=3374599 RepID=UPI003749A4D4|nr:aminoacyl-histidine dipeptidase [Prolixibacteraceae bacterium]